jgi:hypothetical protein
MRLAGATIATPTACSRGPAFRIVMRLSRLGSAVAFDVEVCPEHHRELAQSPHYVESSVLPGA